MKNKNFAFEKKELIDNINKYNFIIPFNCFYNLNENNINSNSWFSINKSPIDDINIKFINNNSTNNIINCKKITILPNKKQTNILLNWMESYRKMYNETLVIIKKLIFEKNKNMFNFRYIRTKFMKKIKTKLTNKSKINSHILDGAIKLACVSYKSASTNLKNKNIKYFKIRPIKQNKKSKIIDLEKCYFFSDGFCKRVLGKMKTTNNFDFSSINSDCKLHYNKLINRFTLLVPTQINCFKAYNNNKFISIDPGIKTFLTGLSNNNIYHIGDNLTEIIKKNLIKIDNLSSINNKKSRKEIESLKRKNYNKITDLHWKSINYLLKIEEIDSVLIGNWSTKNTSSKNNNLDSMNKRLSNSLRFYEFIQKLKYKCSQYNTNLKIVDECYTSKICSFCASTSEITKNRNLKCKCKLNLNRDINGSINILLKSLK
jgi:putative transposase